MYLERWSTWLVVKQKKIDSFGSALCFVSIDVMVVLSPVCLVSSNSWKDELSLLTAKAPDAGGHAARVDCGPLHGGGSP
jgi:hypothetical protein